MSKSTARECVDQKELHEIARLQEALDIESATSELDGEHFEGEIMSHAIQGKFGQHHYLSCFGHAGLGFRVRVYGLRYVGLMWPPFLIGRLHSSGTWQGFVVKNGHQKDIVMLRLDLVLKI